MPPDTPKGKGFKKTGSYVQCSKASGRRWHEGQRAVSAAPRRRCRTTDSCRAGRKLPAWPVSVGHPALSKALCLHRGFLHIPPQGYISVMSCMGYGH
jgi:hypothetical protein